MGWEKQYIVHVITPEESNLKHMLHQTISPLTTNTKIYKNRSHDRSQNQSQNQPLISWKSVKNE